MELFFFCSPTLPYACTLHGVYYKELSKSKSKRILYAYTFGSDNIHSVSRVKLFLPIVIPHV